MRITIWIALLYVLPFTASEIMTARKRAAVTVIMLIEDATLSLP